MIIDFYRLIPTFWMQNTKTCIKWDRELNLLLDYLDDAPLPHLNNIKINDYTINFGEKSIWISNFPYNYGSNNRKGNRVLPKVKTRLRLRRVVTKLKSRKLSNEYILAEFMRRKKARAGKPQPSIRPQWAITLGLRGGEGRREINKRANELLKVHHPDVGGSLQMAQKINEARTQALNNLHY